MINYSARAVYCLRTHCTRPKLSKGEWAAGGREEENVSKISWKTQFPAPNTFRILLQRRRVNFGAFPNDVTRALHKGFRKTFRFCFYDSTR